MSTDWHYHRFTVDIYVCAADTLSKQFLVSGSKQCEAYLYKMWKIRVDRKTNMTQCIHVLWVNRL